MKTTIQTPTRKPVIALFALVIIFMSTTNKAYSQVDYSFGKNKKGFRIGAGIGFTQLMTHYDENPVKPNLLGTVDYDFNPYLSVGIEGQIGTLKGIDSHTPAHYYYTSSTNQYKSVNVNIKASVGLIYNFHSNNQFEDALKRTYVGAGYGVMKNDITFTTDPNLETYIYSNAKPYGYVSTIPMDIGTYIDLPNVFGRDRLEVNPNFQLTYIPSLYCDGFMSSQYSHLKGYYSCTSITLKLKF